MPWGYTFPEVLNGSQMTANGRVNTVYISEYDCFDLNMAPFDLNMALFDLNMALLHCIWDPVTLYMGPCDTVYGTLRMRSWT